MILIALFACTDKSSSHGTPSAEDLMNRAYVVSEGSNELFVFDYVTLQEVGSIDTGARTTGINGNHMAMVSMDATKVYITAADDDSLVIVDAASLEIEKTMSIGSHATHMAFRPGTDELWIMAEDDNQVVVLDTATDEVARKISDPSLAIPHFARFSGDRAYIPSIGGNQVSIVDLATYQVIDTLVGDGLAEGACEGDPCGYADAQIDPNGVLFASNFTTGRVMVYDTISGERRPDVMGAGGKTWSAFVDPFDDVQSFAFAPSWMASKVARIGADGSTSEWNVGDTEVYGVNYSPTSPDEAFVLNRTRSEVAVIDRASGDLLDTLDVGGNTETGTTTTDGKLLLPISSAGDVAVYDTVTHEELARYSGVGIYPWSVTTAAGQNYCH